MKTSFNRENESIFILQPSTSGHCDANALPKLENNDHGEKDPNAQSSFVDGANAETTHEVMHLTNGKNGIKDRVFILHARDDENIAREIKMKIERELGSHDKQLIEVSADVGLGNRYHQQVEYKYEHPTSLYIFILELRHLKGFAGWNEWRDEIKLKIDYS
ncbi:hypothetical protein DPMN_029412 [Dreissena polymorpha]|uniref:Uncharacterized protein n=1 Tax=Dreissena polymorpha TaxID=45954 RepID=A0A9D4LY45_DREPO|nr:hypothetical protein DPMN_029412 [Dreissena polymorpha]